MTELHRVSVLLILLLSSFFGLAQIDNSDWKVELLPFDLGVCGINSDEIVMVTAKKSTLSNFQIRMDLPDGVDYVPGTLVKLFGSSIYTVNEVDVSNLNEPIFSIESTGNWIIGHQVRFSIERTAGCEAVQFKDAGGVFKDAQFISYLDNGSSETASDTNLSVYTYNLLAASISIQNHTIQLPQL